MVLNNLRIPPYPSLEENQNAQQLAIVDKSIINDKILTRREQDKKITRLFTATNIEVNQPKGYTMEMIGSLERRIKDLEYYVALNALELQIKDLNLPSSISENINRFKFGFFTDSYDNETFSDTSAQEYKASIDNGRVVPGFEVIKVVHPAPECAYTDYPIVVQTKATGSAAPAIFVANASIEVKEGSENKADKTDTKYITMASTLGNNAGQVAIYMYFYSGADTLSVFQSTTANSFSATPIYTTNNSIAFTNNDVSYAKSYSWFKSFSDSTMKQHVKTTSPAFGMKYGGKLAWNHNPANGRYYKITVKNHSTVWRYRLEYPVNVDGASNTAPSPTPVPTSYKGHIHINQQKDVWTNKEVLSTGGKGKSTYEYEYQKFEINAHGLKPNSLHKVYVNKSDVTNLCDTTPSSTFPPPPTTAGLTAWNTYTGNPFNPGATVEATYVMTDSKGKLSMYLYLLEEERVNKKDFGREVKVKYPLIEIYTADKSSYAHETLAKEIELFYAQ